MASIILGSCCFCGPTQFKLYFAGKAWNGFAGLRHGWYGYGPNSGQTGPVPFYEPSEDVRKFLGPRYTDVVVNSASKHLTTYGQETGTLDFWPGHTAPFGWVPSWAPYPPPSDAGIGPFHMGNEGAEDYGGLNSEFITHTLSGSSLISDVYITALALLRSIPVSDWQRIQEVWAFERGGGITGNFVRVPVALHRPAGTDPYYIGWSVSAHGLISPPAPPFGTTQHEEYDLASVTNYGNPLNAFMVTWARRPVYDLGSVADYRNVQRVELMGASVSNLAAYSLVTYGRDVITGLWSKISCVERIATTEVTLFDPTTMPDADHDQIAEVIFLSRACVDVPDPNQYWPNAAP